MSLLTRPLLWVRRTTGVLRIPAAGELVWWASKQIGCTVTKVSTNGILTFQGGEIIKNKKGRQVPRWTVQSRIENATFDPATQYWIVGEGLTPKVIRGVVVTPKPVSVSGYAQGSFATARKV